MRIDEAITNLSIQIEGKHPLAQKHQAEAIQLGIGALKLVKAKRLHFEVDINRPLPGETKD